MGTHPIFESDFDCLTEVLISTGFLSWYTSLDMPRMMAVVASRRRKEAKQKMEAEKKKPHARRPNFYNYHMSHVDHANMESEAPEIGQNRSNSKTLDGSTATRTTFPVSGLVGATNDRSDDQKQDESFRLTDSFIDA